MNQNNKRGTLKIETPKIQLTPGARYFSFFFFAPGILLRGGEIGVDPLTASPMALWGQGRSSAV